MAVRDRRWPRRWQAVPVLAVFLATLFLAGCPGPARRPAPEGRTPGATADRNQNRDTGVRGDGRLHVLAFYDEDQERPREQVLSLVRLYRREIDYLAPFWFKIQPDGSVVDEAERDVDRFARRERIRLQPLFTNAEGTDRFLRDPAARRRAVGEIVRLVRERNYAGASIDFQLLEPGSRDAFTAFMKDLYGRLRPLRKVVTVDVIPFGEADQPSSPYDYAALARNSDQLVLMTYDRHGQKSEPGAVAPLRWVEDMVKTALRVTRPDRVILGLAAYGYDWKVGVPEEARVLPLKQIAEVELVRRAREFGARVQRTDTGIPHYTYTDGQGIRHEVWYEDARAIVPKMQLAKRYGLHGVSIWRVGYEDRDYWEAIRRNR
ncbi:MAG: glycoside hydrolase family 18 [Clostridia bacterium]|nr:glycoside hydrolase family 18 [Clostridia bacterium]